MRLVYSCVAGTTVKTVSTLFATMLGVSPATCKLFYQGSELTDQTLQQVLTALALCQGFIFLTFWPTDMSYYVSFCS